LEIGIIGAGQIGGTLTRLLSARGHSVRVSNSCARETLSDLAAKPGAPVIETNNYYPQQRDGRIEGIEDGTPESVWVSELLGAPVFKVFNGIYWKHLLERALPPGAEGRIALPIAGDDPANKKIVSDLVDELGFDPVDAGSLAESWRQQPDTPVYGTDLDAEGVKRALAEASPDRPDAFRVAA
jgi:predicted dinucleotide-binding enzyme